MDVVKLYTDILNACGCRVDNEGFVYVDPSVFTGQKDESKSLPLIVNEKRVVLPTFDQLRSGGDKIVFHPLNENILRDKSDVLVKLTTAFTIRLNHLFFIAVKTAIQMIYDIDSHKRFTPAQHELLSIAPDLNENTAVDLVRMMRKATEENPNCFVSIYLKRSGVIGDKKYSRLGVVSFPFYEELKKDQETHYGVKLRKKDRAGIIKIIEFIFHDIEKQGSYNRGSNSQVAPFMDCLMKTVMSVGSKTNDYFETYRSVISGFDEGMIIASDWVEAFENIDSNAIHIRKIPVQAGNEGNIKKELAPQVSNSTSVPVTITNVQSPVQPEQKPTYTTPQQYTPPTITQPISQPVNNFNNNQAVKSNGKASFAAIANNFYPGQVPPSMIASDPNALAMHQQMMMQQQYAQMQRSSGVRSTSSLGNGFNNQFQMNGFTNQFNGGFNTRI